MRIAVFYEARPDSSSQDASADLYAEFETIETIQAIVFGLESLGHTVTLVNSQDNPLQEMQRLRSSLDLVLNTSVGIGSRFRELMPAAICEALGLPYTGSDPMALALAANKHVAKLIAQHVGVATPPWFIIAEEDDVIRAQRANQELLLKPTFEGSSIGVRGPFRPVDDFESFRSTALHLLKTHCQPVMAENFISGYEVTIALLGNPPRPLPPLGLFLDNSFLLKRRIFDSSAKMSAPDGVWRHNPPIPSSAISTMQEWAKRMHIAMGCCDFSRSDFRVSNNFEPFFTEINPVPQLAPEGNSFTAAGAALGLDFKGILESIITTATNRYHGESMTLRLFPKP